MSKIPCPNCASSNTCRIMYGMPTYTDKLNDDLEAGRIHLGGCILTDNDPNRHCNDCEVDFDSKAPNIYLDIDGVLLANARKLRKRVYSNRVRAISLHNVLAHDTLRR